MLRVFLCHSSGDKPTVRELYQRLLGDGFAPWLDEENLLPGQDWEREIRREIHRTDVVIVCFSHSSTTKSGYIQKEIRIVLDESERKPEGSIFVIPARLEDCVVPDRLMQWQRVDLFKEHEYEKLLRVLRERAAKQESTDASSSLERLLLEPNPWRLGRFADLRIHRLAGGEDARFGVHDLRMLFENIQRVLPLALERTHEILLAKAQHRALARGAPFQNNRTVYLRNLRFTEEDYRKLEITFGPATYFQHIAFVNALDEFVAGSDQTIRATYFQDPERTCVSSACSVFLNVLTDRGKKVILTRRGKKVALSSGVIAETFCGTMNPDKDVDPVTGAPSAFLTAVRKAKEELGLDLLPQQITFRYVIMGLDDPTVGFVGDVQIVEAAEQVVHHALFQAGAEADRFCIVKFNPQGISDFLRLHDDQTAPLGRFTILASLLGAYGSRVVEKAFQ
jgi:TIR domain